MKPIVVADEMFPEGAGGPFMELDEVNTPLFGCDADVLHTQFGKNIYKFI